MLNNKNIDKKILDKIKAIVQEFIIDGKCTEILTLGTGHINDSYLIRTDFPGTAYVLQRINHHVFKNIPGLINNIVNVTHHIEMKILSGDRAAQGLTALKLIKERTGGFFYRDIDGCYWRTYNFINNTISYDQVKDPLLAQEGGKAFGRFQYLTSDLPGETLAETIPDFHDIEKRLISFRRIKAKDLAGRVNQVNREADLIEQKSGEMKSLALLIDKGKIPLRVTHNDTKFNNILFNKEMKAVCIVDLDTVMPGTILYDFGDAIRTVTNTGNEDESDLKKVNINLDLFTAYSKGYLNVAQQFLNDHEKDNLAFSAKYMTFIIGLRFLTDHIDGDKYFRIHFENHNLQRARAQFRLLESMEENFEKMKRIILQIVK